MISWLKWLLAQVKAWFQVVMRISDYESLQAHTDDSPISASLGPIDRLIRLLQSLERSSSKHIVPVGLRANQICILVKHLKKFRDQLKNLSEMEDNSFRAKWWMKEIRELCYDTEDYLEEFMRESGAGALGRIASIILYWIQSKLKWRPQLSQFISRAEVLTEISQNSLQEEIKSASISLKKGNKTDISFEKENKPDIERLTSKLVELLAFDDHKQIQLKVVAISGSAGIGKTTLARTLYVKSKMRFHCSAFVWVSRNPDIMSLLTSILSQIKAPPPHGFPDMQDLIVSISTHLERKRYFIVIDDVRRTTVWDIISRAFPVGQCGSRIIITTQSEHVASACSGYELESTIFQIDAVNSCTDTTSEEKNEVLNLRYNNLPLHLKTCLLYLGMYLEGCTITKEDLVKQWAAEGFIAALQRCRTEEISEVLQCGREEISKVPRKKKDEISEASQDQSSEIEEVPKDEKGEIEEIPQDKGVERAEAPKKETEQIAGGYFDELVTRGMIQPVDKNHKGEVLSCIVHHMVLDLIRYKSKEDNFMVVVDNLESTIGHPDIVRRLSIQFGSEKGASIPESIILSQVRSLAFCGFLKCVPSVADFGLLRVLILNIWADEDKIFDLTRIGELYHLIYLKIECNITVRLPSEIQMLHHLSTLQVGARLFDVPSGIVHLEKLLHLLLPSECILPHGIGSMTSLRTLGYFDLGSNSENNVRCLDELKNLQDLQLTCSTREPAENLEKNMQLLLGSVLQKLSFLRSVTLVPASGSCKGNAQPDYGAASSMSISCDGFSSLVPVSARHLEILELSPHCCIFSRLPKWLAELAQLCVLKIAVRELTKEDINILKGLSALAALSLHVASVSSEIIVFGKGGFSFLTYFKFTCHVPWLKFEADAMPNLQKLSLGFNATIVDKQGVIIEYLSGIKEISAVIGCVVDGAEPAWQKAITNDPRNPKVQWMGSAFYGDQGTGHMVTEEYCITQDIEKNICHDISKDDPLNLAEKIVRNLENATKDLDAKGNDVRREIADAELQHRTPTNEAKRWLQKVDKIIRDVEVISQDCRQLKKDVTMLASEKLHEVQECLSSCPSSVAIESMPPPVQEMSGPSMSAENSNLQDALRYIKDDPTAGMIGIWGPGGVGKTHLLKNIKNSFGGCMTFDFVVFVTASKECSVEKVQSQIIERLKLRSSASKSHIIYEYMKTKSFLVLLDDLWDEIDLEDVGIPYPLGSVNNLNRKVVLTTRLRKVCGQMNVKKELKVAYLQEHEAWQLFKENIGAETLSSPHIEALARKLVKELKGLPLALITIGKAMYRKDEYQWETAIQYMKQSCCVDDKDPIELGMETNVFRRLKFSYDNLRSKTLRDCFLTCALWPEDENIRKVDLAQCWMGLGLVNEHDIESSFRKSYSLIADLTAACLLEGCENDLPRYFKKPDDSVKVHGVIRDMALWISCDCGENNDKWIVATPGGIDQKVITLSNKAECVSLMSNRDQKVITLSNKAECISLMSNRLPIRFDLDPIELRILCLRNNRLDESIIVEAIKNCSSLTYLDLRSNNLKRIPKELCSLVKLEHLDLSENQFGETEVPHSFGKLINLKFLYLRSFDGLRIPAGVISSLKALQVIDLRGFLRKSILHKWIFLELGTLPQLKALGLGVQHFPQFKSLLGEAANLPVRYLNMQSVGADLTGILSTDFAQRTLYELDIMDWGTREIIVEHDTEQPNTHFAALNYLRLGGMTSFREMKWMGATPTFIFPRLTCLELFCCPNISHLSWVMYLPRLEELCIQYCSGMVQAFMRCHGDKLCDGQDKTKTFPCLKLLILGYNKSLETIGDKGMEFPSLGRLEIIECPKLKRLPFQLDSLPPKLKELWFSDAQCWERLEWEEGVKTLLQPVLKFWQRI